MWDTNPNMSLLITAEFNCFEFSLLKKGEKGIKNKKLKKSVSVLKF